MALLNKQQAESSSGSSVGTGFLAGKHFCFHTSFPNGNWIVDSGASDHITPNLGIFTSVQKLSVPGFITMPNGRCSKIAHVGSVQLSSILLLDNVLHVPDFQFNLLSVSKLCDQVAGRVIFTSTDCTLQGPKQPEVVLGKACNGLYHAKNIAVDKTAARKEALVLHSGIQQACSQPMFGQHFKFSELDSWHFRLGHLSFDKIKHINLPCTSTRTSNICSICPKARLHRESFPLSNSIFKSFSTDSC